MNPDIYHDLGHRPRIHDKRKRTQKKMNPDTTPTPTWKTDVIESQKYPPKVENKALRALSRQLGCEIAEKTNEVERLRELLNRATDGINTFHNTKEEAFAHAEEPTINQSQIVQSDPVPTQPPTQNEWRELGPDEVIQEGDEYNGDGDPNLRLWIPCNHSVGYKKKSFEGKVRTRRPLPKQEEMPLEDEIERIETRDAWIDPTKDIIACIRYLRNEIQKLQATVNKTTPNS